MLAEGTLIDAETARKIQNILELCGTHTASVSIRTLHRDTDKVTTDAHRTTFTSTTGDGLRGYTTSADGDVIFHIASITKVLVAVAIFIAAEIKAKEDDRYARFALVPTEPLTHLYNQCSDTKMGDLPGNPSLFQLMVHYRGFDTFNHRLLAPDGTPIMTSTDLRQDLIPAADDAETHVDMTELWSQYSNVNYAAIAIAVEALWGHGFDNFMDETLFKPLGMKSTSIGFQADKGTHTGTWAVDSQGKLNELPRPNYQATGAEAGALGAYSSAQDLDTFFKFLLDSFHGDVILPGFDVALATKMMRIETLQTDDIIFTPLGLYTRLDSTTIGSQSSNRLQFPEETFSTYPVLPGPLGEEILLYYMAGSAVGCSCAAAFKPSESKTNLAIVVLTDTSGPVDSADHILRLILRRIAQSEHSQWSTKLVPRAEGITKMVKKAMARTKRAWKEIESVDANLKGKSHPTRLDITGDYKAKGFNQLLQITGSQSDGLFVTLSGSSTRNSSRSFQLVWMDSTQVKICIPPHLSIDCLGDGDWSNLVFKVNHEGSMVTNLVRETAQGEDHFIRA